MTPKEKAIELVSKYRKEILKGKYHVDGFIVENLSEECALIAVDEIFKTGYLEGTTLSINKKYWQEVKQEIKGGEQ